jgi:large subunit ribosomal protein L2
MSHLIFQKKALSNLLVALKPNKSISSGRRVLRTKKNPLRSKRMLRLVNFMPHVLEDYAQLVRIERDPARSAFIGLFRFLRSGFLSYLLVPSGLKVGDFFRINYPSIGEINFKQANPGNWSFSIKPLVLHAKGSIVHNLECAPFKGFKLCRAAGSSAVLEATSLKLGIVKILLPSGKFAFLPGSSYAASGAVSNDQHHNTKLRKAGQAIWRGVRPLSRGVAMNPVDHPHGGGEGKTSGGRPSVSFTAVLTKGFKTVKYKKVKKLNFIKKRFEIFK